MKKVLHPCACPQGFSARSMEQARQLKAHAVHAEQAQPLGQPGIKPGGKWEKQAVSTLAQTRPFEEMPVVVSEAYIQEKLPVFPKQRALPASFVKHVQTSKEDWPFRRCLGASAGCAIWLGDLNSDGQNEILLFNSEQPRRGTVFIQSNGTWKQAGTFSSQEFNGKFDSAKLEEAQISKPDWSGLMVDGKRFRVQQNQQ